MISVDMSDDSIHNETGTDSEEKEENNSHNPWKDTSEYNATNGSRYFETSDFLVFRLYI